MMMNDIKLTLIIAFLRVICCASCARFIIKTLWVAFRMNQPDDDRAAYDRLRGSSSLSNYSISNQPIVGMGEREWRLHSFSHEMFRWQQQIFTSQKSLSWLTNTLDSRQPMWHILLRRRLVSAHSENELKKKQVVESDTKSCGKEENCCTRIRVENS